MLDYVRVINFLLFLLIIIITIQIFCSAVFGLNSVSHNLFISMS